MRPTYAVINLTNLKNNYLNIRKKVKDAKVMAVVKADAYGHGVEKVTEALNSLGKNRPEFFGVAISDEAVHLRNMKIPQPILVFDPFSKFNIDDLLDYKISATVFTKDHIKLIKREINRRKSFKNKIPVHVKIDTGMNRLGINYSQAVQFIEYLNKQNEFKIEGIYTHFATSDERNKSYAKSQLGKFKQVLSELRKKNLNYGLAHSANSGAIIDLQDSYFDMVRPGISLYGYYPSLKTSESIKLKPVMSIISHVTSVKKIEKGESVSYGRLYTAKQKTNIASVPIGYADGFNRNMTNKSHAIINGKKYKQVGRVTMDRIMFDTGKSKINPGEKVILIGESKTLKIDAWDWSKVLNTIPYEITCSINKRVPRVYKD